MKGSLTEKECTMRKHTTMTTGRASLCALGEYLRRHCFFLGRQTELK